MFMRRVVILCLPLLLTGCALSPTATPTLEKGLSIHGNVHGGQQPIIGAHVYLLAANTTGYGQPSVSTLDPTAPNVATDAVGTYVTTDPTGSFSISGDYTCTSGTQLYIYALGGNPGAGTNPASGLLAVLGQCPASGTFAATVPFIWINEVSTVAAAYAMAGYATDAAHVSSSGTPLALTGIANAFANAANLASISNGSALATTPGGNGTVPQAEINTLANILASCINSTGTITGPANPSACYTLFSNAMSNGTSGNLPTDTATAAINIAHYPTQTALFSLQSGIAAPFEPALTSVPTDFTVGITFTGGGLSTPYNIAIDGSGNAWVTNNSANSITELSSSGSPISPAAGYTGAGLSFPQGIAIDSLGNAWVANDGNGSVSELSNSGTPISPSTGYTGGGLNQPQGIAIDGGGNVWVTNPATHSMSKLSSSGVAISPAAGYTLPSLDSPQGVAIDASGNVWTPNSVSNNVTELSNYGAALSPLTTGYTGGGLNMATGITIDGSANVWVANQGNQSVTKLSSYGAALSPSGGFTGGGLTAPQFIAVDGAGNAWVTNFNGALSEISSGGAPLSPATTGFTGGGLDNPTGVAVDGSGDVWVANNDSSNPNSGVTEFIGAAAPVVTPLPVGVVNNTLGTRP
jgi:hypothetical protein